MSPFPKNLPLTRRACSPPHSTLLHIKQSDWQGRLKTVKARETPIQKVVRQNIDNTRNWWRYMGKDAAGVAVRTSIEPIVQELLKGEIETGGVTVTSRGRYWMAVFWVKLNDPVLGKQELPAWLRTLAAKHGSEEAARQYLGVVNRAGAALRLARRNAATAATS